MNITAIIMTAIICAAVVIISFSGRNKTKVYVVVKYYMGEEIIDKVYQKHKDALKYMQDCEKEELPIERNCYECILN